MKKIIPFKKELSFKTNVSEITSISLENNLQNNDGFVDGDVIISGNYKITDASVNVDSFEFKIPINISIDGKYITDDMVIDIDDFYYEIVNNNVLEVNVDVMIDNITEKPMIELAKEDFSLINDFRGEIDKMVEEKSVVLPSEDCISEDVVSDVVSSSRDRCIEEEDVVPSDSNLFNGVFDNLSDSSDDYSTYSVYIVREGDSLDSIMLKYNTNLDVLKSYNDISELKLGDKIIIPE